MPDGDGLRSLGIAGEPLHLVVADAASRGYAKGVRCHACAAAFPPGSFVRAADDVCVSSPSLLFLQMATILSLVELVELGFELCGSYAMDPSDERGFRSRAPLASARSLGKFVARAKGMHGAKKAARAVGFVADGAASPMESVTAMLLCLPSSMGGYGFELPVLNRPVGVTAATGAEGITASRADSAKRCICDLYWPRARVAIEYDSDMFHVGAERAAHDSKRRASLSRAGVSVVSVTRSQVYDARAFDEVACAVARLMGRRLRIRRADWMAQRFELRSQLLRQRGR